VSRPGAEGGGGVRNSSARTSVSPGERITARSITSYFDRSAERHADATPFDLSGLLPDGAIDARAQVSELDHAVTELARDVQGISHELHSSKLEYFGLAVAAGHFCKEVSSHYGTTIEYVHENVSTNLDKDVAISVFRVLQEAMSNVVKHSGARHCRVTLRGQGDEVQLQVTDDGRGFDTRAAQGGQSLGLISMQERLRLVNGEVTVDSTPGMGTTVRASAPSRTTQPEASSPQPVALGG
jgi:signal transduction histidine kinase